MTKKQVLIGAGLISAMIAAPIAAMADSDCRGGDYGSKKMGYYKDDDHRGGPRGGHHGGMGFAPFGGNSDLTLDADQVRTVFEAMLIRHGESNLKVGTITPKKEGGYTVQIVTKEDSLVRELDVNKAGVPVRR